LHLTGQAARGIPESNFVIFGLCRFIPAVKAGLSRHLPVKFYNALSAEKQALLQLYFLFIF
jgi:hypothetical protein